MNKSNALFILVKSLSKPEKRAFRLSCGQATGETRYESLFACLDGAATPEEARTAFGRRHPGSPYEATARHLYGLLLDELARLRRRHDIRAQLFGLLERADLLFERGLGGEALDELARAKEMAGLYRKDALLLAVRQSELRYLGAMGFEGVDEKKLVGKQIQIMETIKRIRSAALHTQLYDILRHRFLHRGHARSRGEGKALDDLVLQEINLVANSPAQGFETEKLHLLFQATYFLHGGHYEAALRTYRRLIDLFEANPLLLLNPPIHYFSALCGILDTLEGAGLDAEIPYFTARLEAMEQGGYPEGFTLDVRARRYLYASGVRVRGGDFAGALHLRGAFEEGLFKREGRLGLEMQLRLHLHAAGLFLWLGDRREARRHMGRILAAGKLLHAFPLYRVARLLNLLIQAEAGNDDFLGPEVRALRRARHLEKSASVHATEEMVFRFVGSCPLPGDRAACEALWKNYEGDEARIRRRPDERPLLTLFDFPEWIHRRLTAASAYGK